MGFFKDILSVLGFLDKIFEFIKKLSQNYKRTKEKTKIDDLSKKTEDNIKQGNIEDLNKNLM